MTDGILTADTAFWINELQREGWCIIPDALPTRLMSALNRDLNDAFAATPFGQGHFYGETTKRFGRLLTRSPRTEAVARHPLIISIAERLLLPACDCIQLNVAQAIAVHPGAPAQPPHRDQDMWQAPKGETEYLLNVIWPLTPFRSDNGATLVWSRSHGAAQPETDCEAAPIAATMPPGSALLFLGSTLHGAGANVSRKERRAVVMGYSLGWLKPYENPWLAYPPHVARRFTPELAALIGYRQHRPNLGNFEGQCPSVLLGDKTLGSLGAIDALRPEQKEMVDAFARTQLTVAP